MATPATAWALKLTMFQSACEAYGDEIHRFPFLQLEMRQLARHLARLSLAEAVRRLDRVEGLARAARKPPAGRGPAPGRPLPPREAADLPRLRSSG